MNNTFKLLIAKNQEKAETVQEKKKSQRTSMKQPGKRLSSAVNVGGQFQMKNKTTLIKKVLSQSF